MNLLLPSALLLTFCWTSLHTAGDNSFWVAFKPLMILDKKFLGLKSWYPIIDCVWLWLVHGALIQCSTHAHQPTPVIMASVPGVLHHLVLKAAPVFLRV